MSGIRGNEASWAVVTNKGKGAEKGAAGALAAGSLRVPFSGGDTGPSRTFGKLAETDASRYQGKSYAKVGGVTGSPETYGRVASLASIIAYTMGKITSAGAAKKYTQTIEPGATVPYVSVIAELNPSGKAGETSGNTALFEEYSDCVFNSFQVKTTAGEPLTIAANLLGLKTTRLTANPFTTPATPVQAGYVLNMNDAATVELGGAATHAISSFDLTYSNNANSQQTDSFSPQDVVTGLITVDLTFDMLFENLDEYNKYNYGGTANGTAESNKLYETSSKFIFKAPTVGGVEESIEFSLPYIAFETFPITPNVTGAPVVVSVKAVGQRPASGPILKVLATTGELKEVAYTA